MKKKVITFLTEYYKLIKKKTTVLLVHFSDHVCTEYPSSESQGEKSCPDNVNRYQKEGEALLEEKP